MILEPYDVSTANGEMIFGMNLVFRQRERKEIGARTKRAIVRCPYCGKVMSSTNSFKNSGTPKQKVYYHVTCKNSDCKSKGLHYNCDKI